jgi:DNA polymerase I-like protein with 3'-5' exonuclease and polymerase domains
MVEGKTTLIDVPQIESVNRILELIESIGVGIERTGGVLSIDASQPLNLESMERAAAERAAVNMPMQGTQADLIKLAMVRIAPLLPEGADMLLQIHDELIVECNQADASKVAQLMQKEMEGIAKLKVPIVVDTSIGQNWGEL